MKNKVALFMAHGVHTELGIISIQAKCMLVVVHQITFYFYQLPATWKATVF